MIAIRLLTLADAHVLDRVAPDVFDGPVVPALAAEFLADPRHHLAVAVSEAGEVVGMATGVHYVHPDKRRQLFINEVGVAPACQGRGVGKRLLAALLDRARDLGCSEAWVATDPDNGAAQRLYASCGGVRDAVPFVMYSFPLDAQPAAGE